MQGPVIEGVVPFSHEVLIEMYQNIDYSKRAKTLQIFMAENTPLPIKNPPNSSSLFPDRTRHIATVISYLLDYYSYQWIDEAIIAFLSILSIESKPYVLFTFIQFQADEIHEQLVNFFIDEFFHYSSVLVYMFLYFQTYRF